MAGGREMRAALASLRVIESRTAIDGIAIARWLTHAYPEVDRASWSNFCEAGLYQATAEATKAASSIFTNRRSTPLFQGNLTDPDQYRQRLIEHHLPYSQGKEQRDVTGVR
jgi:hypothetical protein